MHVASLVDAVVSDDGIAASVLAAQDAALARLKARDFAGTLLGFVERIAAAPRRGTPKVAFDFWDQLRAYERLEELRMFRPSVFKGLPR
jgi:hypothetical protein